ncbi:MAG: glutaminyl-peptide cyclotransferase [Candidatus Amulumruptor caecigallinarius]|nr:glutaminyl-peptide cyclotransferase [Candidatus Amulumruptor caecigallinarius]
MKQTLIFILSIVSVLMLQSCMKWDYDYQEEDLSSPGKGLFICNEGNFQYSNASLSYYDPESMIVQNDVFYRSNGMRLGDVAQSITIHDNKAWIVVDNSHVIFAIDVNNFKEVGRIENFTAARYILFINDEKAYVTQLWDNRIFVINPKTYQITGYIEVPNMTMETGSTEQMVKFGKYVFCNCWSYQNRIIKIDTETDKVVDELSVGIQPASIVLDKYDKLWTITDGGYPGSPYGYEAPKLYKIDAQSFQVEHVFNFRLGDSPSELCTNGDRSEIYWLNDDVWKMNVKSNRLPLRPLIKYQDTKYYGLTVSPYNGDIYVADAIDYQQNGIIYRYTPDALLTDKFYVGISPGAFCWK